MFLPSNGAANLDRPRAHLDKLRHDRWGGITEIGLGKYPAVIIINGAKRERWEHIGRGFYEMTEPA